MIVPMKKIFVIVSHREARIALDTLGELSVMHLAHLHVPQSGDIDRLREEASCLNRAVNILKIENKNLKVISRSVGKYKTFLTTRKFLPTQPQLSIKNLDVAGTVPPSSKYFKGKAGQQRRCDALTFRNRFMRK